MVKAAYTASYTTARSLSFAIAQCWLSIVPRPDGAASVYGDRLTFDRPCDCPGKVIRLLNAGNHTARQRIDGFQAGAGLGPLHSKRR